MPTAHNNELLFDSKCRDLAEHFLPHYALPIEADRLAACIQHAVEDWLLSHEGKLFQEFRDKVLSKEQ